MRRILYSIVDSTDYIIQILVKVRLTDSVSGKMIPLDYEALKKDDEYKYYLRTYKGANISYLEFSLKINKNNVSELILSIENELKVLEKEE